jgi:AcrR family transcriptional regulator
MFVNKSRAAELAGVSRRTFYNHIPTKRISVIKDEDGTEKVNLAELERVYGKETVLRNLKRLEDANDNTGNGTGNSVKDAQPDTPRPVQYEKLLLEEKLKGFEVLIEEMRSERERLVEDKKRLQEQLDKALEIGAPIGKLLTDQREFNEGRAVAERKAIEESIKKEAAEKRLKLMAKKLHELQAENEALKGRGLFKKLFG